MSEAGGSVDVKFRVRGEDGGYYTNSLTENFEFDGSGKLKTRGKMYGLTFDEKWTIVGGNDTPSTDVGKFWIVRYRGRTLQGDYEGGFVLSERPQVSSKEREMVAEVWKKASGGDFSKDFKAIDNACQSEIGGKGELKREQGKVGGAEEWKELIVGEGGIGDWIRPGWRGEYNK